MSLGGLRPSQRKSLRRRKAMSHFSPGHSNPVLLAEDDLEDHQARRTLLRQAQAGSVTALVDLWRRWHVRLPLVEARTGWSPTVSVAGPKTSAPSSPAPPRSA